MDLKSTFDWVSIATPLSKIHDKDYIISLQEALIATGWLKGNADGIVGDLTTKAWANFKSSHWQKDLDLVGPGSIQLLIEDIKDLQGKPHPIPVEPKTNYQTIAQSRFKLPSGVIISSSQEIVPGINLTWGEMTKGLSRKPTELYIEGNLIEVAKIFGKIRNKLDAALIINSGYRPAVINRAVGGVSNSQHVQGLAIDFSCNNLTNLLAATRAVLRDRGSGGIGLGMSRGFVHFDIGKNRRSLVEFGY